MSAKDNIYSNKHSRMGDFKFDAQVTTVFDDMISRSVPGYREIVSFVGTITKQFQQPNQNYYDLGCSLGAGMLAMASAITEQGATIIGVDNSAPMIAQAEQHLAQLDHDLATVTSQYNLRCENIEQTEIDNAAIVLMNFTLQFIEQDKRTDLLHRIYQGMNNGAVVMLSEKVHIENTKAHILLTDLHHQFKADQGYSELEISRKRDAIENVLIPELLDTHIERLHEAGFSLVIPWFQNFQFFSLLAVK